MMTKKGKPKELLRPAATFDEKGGGVKEQQFGIPLA